MNVAAIVVQAIGFAMLIWVARQTVVRLNVIHTLVNSNMTAHMQSELDAIVRELAMMREVSRLHEDAGRAPTEETLAAIQLTESKVAELRAVLSDRYRAQDATG